VANSCQHIFTLGWPCIICKYFVSFPTWYTFIFFIYLQFFFIYLQFSSYNFLYMFRTGWSIIRRIKLHVQSLAPFPRSLLSRAWPLAPTATHEITTNKGKVPEAARVTWFSWWWTSRSKTCRENCKYIKKIKVYQVGKETKYLVNMVIHPQVPLRAENFLTIYVPTGHSRTLLQGVS